MPLVATQDLGRLYPDTYDAHRLPANAALRALATLLFRARYRRAMRTPPLGALQAAGPGRLLDVGSGRGDLGVVLRERGWDVTGLEPSADASREAEERGVHTVVGTLTTSATELADRYDAVVFQHSLEHVADPAEDLAAARALLRDGGLLLVSLPNFGSWQRRRFRARWFHLDLPRHRTHFSPRGLELLLRRQGFAPLEIGTSTSIDGLPGSLQYRLFGRRRFERGPGRYAVIGLSLALAPVSAAINALAGGGDVLTAVATKAEAAE
jgi:SAM-dependent methyltransferase